jgi:plasmid stabilization system protein ParE
VAQGFDLHPLAAQDITDIWEFIANDSMQGAARVREAILDYAGLYLFPTKATDART